MNSVIGIDISKNSFDVHCFSDGSDQHIDYTSQNIQKTVEHLCNLKPQLIVMEATGGYEIPLAEQIQAAGLPLAVVNPKRVRDFAKAVGQTAKTDKIDARIIAKFGATLEPPTTHVLNENTRKISSLVARKRQLINMRTAEKNRMEHARDQFIGQSIRTVIEALNSQISSVEQQILDIMEQTSELKQKSDVIVSFPGIGKSTAASLVSGLPELGNINRRQIASLIGTAPINRDSGKFRGKRMTGGGRYEIRKQLYMPTLAAIRHNTIIRSYYQRLVSVGKNKMVAVVACMRKIIVILNSMIAKNQAWKTNCA